MNVYHCDRCDEVYAIVIPIAVGAMSEKRRLEVEREIEHRRAAHLAARHADDQEKDHRPQAAPEGERGERPGPRLRQRG